jgi:hypothetical protein
MTTNEAGNFWTFAAIASNPYAIASHGATELIYSVNSDGSVNPADASDSRTWQYKAWVKNPDGAVRQMITLPPIGGSTKGSSVRMSCNMHHSPFGSTGAAWASRKGSLSAYPSASLSSSRECRVGVEFSVVRRVAVDQAGARGAATPGRDFDPLHGDSWLRLSFAGSAEDIAEAARRLAEWLPRAG